MVSEFKAGRAYKCIKTIAEGNTYYFTEGNIYLCVEDGRLMDIFTAFRDVQDNKSDFEEVAAVDDKVLNKSYLYFAISDIGKKYKINLSPQLSNNNKVLIVTYETSIFEEDTVNIIADIMELEFELISMSINEHKYTSKNRHSLVFKRK